VVRRASSAQQLIPEAPSTRIERWWRARFLVAGVVAAGGIAAMVGEASATATVLLLAAGIAAASTMATLAWWRDLAPRMDAVGAAARAWTAVLLADLALALAAARAAPPDLTAWGVPLLLAALVLDLRILRRLFELYRLAERRRFEAVLRAAREPIGIVRARADALRLALCDSTASAEVRHELAVLELQIDRAQEALAKGGVPLRLDSAGDPPENHDSARDRQAWPNESRPMPS